MPRFFPPHLMVLVTLLIVVAWFMLLHYFRRNTSLQRFVAELFGDNTPENALMNFELAKQRLAEHLVDGYLNGQLRQRIELALGTESEEHGKRQCEPREEFSVSDRS